MNDPNIKLECIRLAARIAAGPEVFTVAQELYEFVTEARQ
jgi:hypothetical protein